VPDEGTLDEVRGRLEGAGSPVEAIEGGIETRDPAGNRVRILVES
jgi:catechol 2,3-dioxygenase